MPQLQPVQTSENTVCRNPATGEIIGYSPVTSVNAMKRIIETARAAQVHWSRLPVQQRAKYMFRVRDYLVTNTDEIAEIIWKDSGKTRVDALSTEVLPAIMAVDYYAKHAKNFLKDQHTPSSNVLLLNKRSKVVRVPYGVIGIISPWNYPFSIPFYEVVMGLLAGNAVVLKVSKETLGVGQKLEECFLSAHLPDGIFRHLNIPGHLAGSAFLKNGIDKLFFTGSVTVAKSLMREASETLTPLVLELGGNRCHAGL